MTTVSKNITVGSTSIAVLISDDGPNKDKKAIRLFDMKNERELHFSINGPRGVVDTIAQLLELVGEEGIDKVFDLSPSNRQRAK